MRNSRNRRYFLLVLFGLGVASIIYSGALRAITRQPVVPTELELKASLPDATRIEERFTPFHHWLGFAGGTQPVGAVFISTELPPEVRGYIGPVPVLVGMDRNGVIKKLIVMRNRETPYYMRLVLRSGLLEKITGKTITQRWEDVDAISGATVSSETIIKDVSTAAGLVAEKLFGLEAPGQESGGNDAIPLAALVFSLGLGLAARLKHRVRIIRWGSLIVGLAVVGLYLSIPLSFSHITSLLAGDFPSWSNLQLLVLLVYVGVTTVIWGPVFCGHVCPFGAMQELAYRATPGFKIRVSASLLKMLQDLRWLVLFVLVVMVFGFDIAEAAGFEPYPYLFDELHRLIFGGESSHADVLRAGIWAFAAVALAMSFGVRRFWCRAFCPTGACLLLLSRHRPRDRIRSGIEV